MWPGFACSPMGLEESVTIFFFFVIPAEAGQVISGSGIALTIQLK